jgi:hypothetical protein
MSITALLDDPAAAGYPDRAIRDAALAAVEAALGGDPDVLGERLLAYYAPDGDECATSFLDGTETDAPDTVTGGDLFAVTTLGIPVPPAAARRLLYDTAHAARVAGCLDPNRLPVDATLTGAAPALVHAMADLHDAVASAVDTGSLPGPDRTVLASALCARKRPELFPVLDRAFCTALGLPAATTPVPAWLVVRSLLRHRHVRRALADAYRLARSRGRGVSLDVYPLRRLYVLTCHVAAGSPSLAAPIDPAI